MGRIVLCSFHLLMLLLLCREAAAQDSPVAIGKQGVLVSVERRDDYFKVDASVILPVPPCQAYAFLTDYASLPDYIPGMLEISVERLSDTRVKVRQLAEAKVLFFSIDVATVLEMDEAPNRHIAFRQVEGDLESYSGVWKLLEVPEGTRLTYDAELVFDGYVPTFLGRMVLEEEVSKRFEAVAKEAEARKNRTYPNCDTTK